MGDNKSILIKDEEESIKTKFISFKGVFRRHDLAVMSSKRFENNKLVLNLNDNKFVSLNRETLEEKGYLEHHFHITEIVADELRDFLKDLI